jgi:steroid 5-alpha-reductase/3-oxo-5-alpha-steroid 4-dehydrogenase 1
MALNLESDARLLSLRAPGEAAYKIPRGGLFAWVSCPNYLGEIAEWVGWALASWSIGGAAFAFYTAANLAPRAASHHAWYRRTFSDYPAERKALVPFVW